MPVPARRSRMASCSWSAPFSSLTSSLSSGVRECQRVRGSPVNRTIMLISQMIIAVTRTAPRMRAGALIAIAGIRPSVSPVSPSVTKLPASSRRRAGSGPSEAAILSACEPWRPRSLEAADEEFGLFLVHAGLAAHQMDRLAFAAVGLQPAGPRREIGPERHLRTVGVPARESGQGGVPGDGLAALKGFDQILGLLEAEAGPLAQQFDRGDLLALGEEIAEAPLELEGRQGEVSPHGGERGPAGVRPRA